MVKFRCCAAIFMLLFILSCTGKNGSDYLQKYGIKKDSGSLGLLLNDMFHSDEADKRFALCDQAIRDLQKSGGEDKLILILQDFLKAYPDDPYRAYYFSVIADYYKKQDAIPLAADYYRRILYNTQDLILGGNSIHLLILKEWLAISDTADERITIYSMLINDFPEQVNLGECYYYLAIAYETRGDFEESLTYYHKYLNSPDLEIPGVIDAYEQVQALIRFHDSDKSWTFETLDDLVNAVKYAIARRRYDLLERYQSDNFFILSWSQKMMNLDEEVTIGDLASYKYTRLYYSPTLESFSNEKEAFLKTWGWSYRVKPWYLYFKQIEYPLDPEINGRWEWAGIYMGQPL
ncbi:MAG: hypothetical protein JXA95_06270 [Spirochaetales bacterium]|nr:hypothetical protein [Spirochaetales bacterium]